MEKSPRESKKWLAFAFAELLLSGLLWFAMYRNEIDWPLAAVLVILAAGVAALAIGYIISQSALDKFMRGLPGVKGKPK